MFSTQLSENYLEVIKGYKVTVKDPMKEFYSF